MNLSSLVIPVLLAGVAVCGMGRRVDVYGALTHGADSYIGRVAAVMLGSTETTFYTIAVYFGSAGIHRTRHAVPSALAADLTGFAASALAVRLFFGP